MAFGNCRIAPHMVDVTDGYVKSASPCPSEPKIMAPRYSDPRKSERSCHTSLPDSGIMGRVYHPLRRTSNIQNCDCSARFNKTQKKPVWTGTGECCLKKGRHWALIFFWYSLQYLEISENEDCKNCFVIPGAPKQLSIGHAHLESGVSKNPVFRLVTKG